MIDQLDLSGIERHYEREERGYPPYHPRMMTKVLVYGYCVGVFSSRRLERRLIEDVAFRILAAGNEPDFRTISEFRRIHLKALEGLFVQVLAVARKLGAMKLGRVAIDGSKIKANASKHKAMSHERMLREEQRLREEVKRCWPKPNRPTRTKTNVMGAPGAAMNCRPSWPAAKNGCSALQKPARRLRTSPRRGRRKAKRQEAGLRQGQ